MEKERCPWCLSDALYVDYHDREWGTPVHDDDKLFEFLILEGMQAGLSGLTILRKRENFRRAFDQFSAEKIARYNQKKIDRLMKDAGIIRNKLKIEGAIQNARSFLKTREEFGSFDRYMWQFVDGIPKKNVWKSLKQIPPSTKQSDAMSKDLKERGFRFVGSTICYAHMQACGMVNDHLVTCYRYQEVLELSGS